MTRRRAASVPERIRAVVQMVQNPTPGPCGKFEKRPSLLEKIGLDHVDHVFGNQRPKGDIYMGKDRRNRGPNGPAGPKPSVCNDLGAGGSWSSRGSAWSTRSLRDQNGDANRCKHSTYGARAPWSTVVHPTPPPHPRKPGLACRLVNRSKRHPSRGEVGHA